MSFTSQIVRATEGVPKIAVGILLGILVFGVYVVGFDQGNLFAMAQGGSADPSSLGLMHEFTHDTRHAAGFACH